MKVEFKNMKKCFFLRMFSLTAFANEMLIANVKMYLIGTSEYLIRDIRVVYEYAFLLHVMQTGDDGSTVNYDTSRGTNSIISCFTIESTRYNDGIIEYKLRLNASQLR